MHEWVELVKALRWPCVVIYLSVRFGSEIRQLLTDVPELFRRVRSARAMGVKVELFEQRLKVELPAAERETQLMRLKPPPVPTRPARKKKGELTDGTPGTTV
jgi:hypothetical protein